MKYNITLELLKRVSVQLEANNEEEAHLAINTRLMNEGTEFITREMEDETFDSIRVESIKPTHDQSNPELGTDN